MDNECRHGEHATHLRDHARCLDRMADEWKEQGDKESEHHYRNNAKKCRALADEIDAWEWYIALRPDRLSER